VTNDNVKIGDVADQSSHGVNRAGLGAAEMGLLESVLSSLSIGLVGFDRDLNVVIANGAARRLINLCGRIDESLGCGTDGQAWGRWREFLSPVAVEGVRSDLGVVKYRMGESDRLLRIVCEPLTDAATGGAIGGIAVIEDVTEKVDSENELGQAERAAAMGEVAAKIAHELNNPMDGILRYINLAGRVMDKGDIGKAKDYLNQSKAGLMRMVQIISELLEFSRSTQHACEYAPIEKILSDALKVMDSHLSGIDVEIDNECGGKVGAVKVMSLFQVFCNLIKNAADAMGGRGRLRIVVRCAGESVSVEFRDTGGGIAAEDIERIFDAFYTTKGGGKGTGLGLSICRDIMDKYGGAITAENGEAGGAMFKVVLPLSEKVLRRKKSG
jgi:signal transduction histidine kinase